ncbi:MAG: hypothetical protein AB7N76_06115 [Planctomycetota bacterium]
MSTDALLAAFFTSLGAVVVCLGVAIALAKKHRVNGHIGAIGAMLVAVVAALVFAELLGQRYTFEPLSMRVHLPIAVLATLTVLAPLITGFRYWKQKGAFESHKKAVGVWLTLIVLAIGTGVWMLSTGTRLAG